MLTVIVGVVTFFATLILSNFLYRFTLAAELEKQDKLIKPLTDEAFQEGFDQGWKSASSDVTNVKASYETMFGKK